MDRSEAEAEVHRRCKCINSLFPFHFVPTANHSEIEGSDEFVCQDLNPHKKREQTKRNDAKENK